MNNTNYSTYDYIDSLKEDKTNMVGHLNSIGVPVGESETFTELVKNIPNLVPKSNLSDLTITPTTSQQEFNHSDSAGYNQVIVEAVTSTIDSNIKSENIKKDISILGVKGSLESSILSNAYKVSSLNEMNSLTNVPDGAVCVVTDNSITNATADSQFQVATLPNQVVFDEPFTKFADVRYRAVDESVMLNIMGNLDSKMFSMDGFGDIGGQPVEIRIEYMSEDGGTTYNRVSPEEDTIDFGTPIYCEIPEMWNDAIGKFLQVMTANFSGVFEFKDSKWSFLNIGTTATADNIWSPATFYTSDGMQTSSLNKLSYPKQNVYIQNSEPESKEGLWVTLLSKGDSEYNYSDKITPKLSYVNSTKLDATLNNNENALPHIEMPFSISMHPFNFGGAFTCQLYDAKIASCRTFSEYSSLTFTDSGLSYSIRGLLMRQDNIYGLLFNNTTKEIKFFKYDYTSNEVKFFEVPTWLTFDLIVDDFFSFAYNSQDILFFKPSSLLGKFTISSEIFTELDATKLNVSKYTLVNEPNSVGLLDAISAFFYKDYLFTIDDSSSTRYYNKINILTGEVNSVAYPETGSYIQGVQGFFMTENPSFLVGFAKFTVPNVTVYEFNLETLEFTKLDLTELPIVSFASYFDRSNVLEPVSYTNNLFMYFSNTLDSNFFISSITENYHVNPPINYLITLSDSRAYGGMFSSVFYDNSISDYRILILGGTTVESTPSEYVTYTSSPALYNFTLDFLKENLIAFSSIIDRSVLSISQIDTYPSETIRSKVTLFILPDFNCSLFTPISENISIPIKDVLLFHYNWHSSDFYYNDIKDIYIGDGENWNLLKSHTKNS